MTLGDIYKGRSENFETGTFLGQTYTKINSNISGKANPSGVRNWEAEKILNSLFYSNEKGDKDAQSEYAQQINIMQRAITQAVLNRISEVSAYDILKGTTTLVDLSNVYLSPDKILKDIEAMQSDIDMLMKRVSSGDVGDLEEKIKKLIGAAQQKSSELKQMIDNNLGNKTQAGLFSLKSFEGDYAQFRKNYIILRNLARALRSMPDVNSLGAAFEQAAYEILNNIKDNTTRALVEQVFGKFTGVRSTGSSLMGRAGASSNKGLIQIVDLDMRGLEIAGIEKPEHMKNLKTQGNGFIVQVTPQSDSYAKADIEFDLPDGDFNGLSLKNWGNLIGSNAKYGFGHTTLLSALYRTGGLLPTRAYALNLLSYHKNGAHTYAELCVVADILMGYCQENGWASEIVINDRSLGYIFVFNIPALIKSMSQQVADLKAGKSGVTTNYPELIGTLEQAAQDIMENVKHTSPGRTNTYIKMMFAVLQSQLVTAKLDMSLAVDAFNSVGAMRS